MSMSLVLPATIVALAAMFCFAASRAWRGWLELKRLELEARDAGPRPSEGDVALRIELAAVRERLKRLERIADGVEL